MQVANRDNHFIIEGMGIRISLGQLIGKRLFGEDELRRDVISGKLRLTNYDYKEELAEICKDVFREAWTMLTVDRDDLTDYLRYKENESANLQYNILREEIQSTRKLITDQSELLRMMMSEIYSVRKTLDHRSYVTIKEIHSKLFPQYELRSLQNMIAANRTLDNNNRLYRSFLQIGEFRLEFRKPVNSKKWIADRIDYIPEKSKTYDSKFKYVVQDRLKHGFRYVFM